MNALILEDERSSAIRLSKLISNHKAGKNLHLYFSETISEAEEQLAKQKIDLLFLDLKLNSEDGFQLLQKVLSESFYTVIVSAYTELAIEAFEYGVLDFIPKPIFEERVDKALERFFSIKRFNTKTKKLFVKNGANLESIPLKKIIYFQPAGHYTEVILDSGLKKLHNLSLDNILKILPANFERIHRGYIVNIDFIKMIKSYSGSKYEIKLINGEKLPLGRQYAKSIKSLFSNKQ